MEDALQLIVAGIPVAVTVALGVQGLKVFNLVDAKSAPRAAILIALVFGALSIAVDLLPVAAPYIEKAFIAFNGAMVAGLGYTYVAKPILEKFGIGISSEDLAAE